mmetsp:Transcript_18301/g.40526  ORF Transcript_18301/g.40526 Transcript_18301/m.40526 type:complete len:111 (+) Transcript_18301:39-371(+)
MAGLDCLFSFSGEAGHLMEVKRLDVASDAPLQDKFFWLWRPSGATSWQKLSFLEMQKEPQQYRKFKEAELWFDDNGAKLKTDTELQLTTAGPAALADGWQESAHAFIKSL